MSTLGEFIAQEDEKINQLIKDNTFNLIEIINELKDYLDKNPKLEKILQPKINLFEKKIIYMKNLYVKQIDELYKLLEYLKNYTDNNNKEKILKKIKLIENIINNLS